MRNYLPHYAKYGIPQPRYNELRNFCLQYPLWQAEAKSLLGVGAQRYSSMPHGSGVGDPVARAAEKREQLLTKIELVERVARSVEGGKWYTALIQNCCMGKGLSYIDPDDPADVEPERLLHRAEDVLPRARRDQGRDMN